MALFWIRFVHTLIFIALTVSVFYLLYSGIADRLTRWTGIALALIVIEGVVLSLTHWQCPLTIWAQKLGAEQGPVADIFLPRWIADRLFGICAPICILACFLVALRWLTK